MTAFVTDSFTDADSTAITSHTGETGATWARHASANNISVPVVNGNSLVTVEYGVNENYYASGVPGVADYTVSAEFTKSGTGYSEVFGPGARLQTSANTGYFFISFWAPAAVRLYKYVAGTLTQIGASVSFVPADGITYRLTIDVAGTTIKGRLQRLSDGNWLNSSGAFVATQTDCISVTDTAISAAGQAGFWLAHRNGMTRTKMDNFLAEVATSGDASVPSATGTSTGSGSGGSASGGTAGLKYSRVDATDTVTGQAIMVLVPNSNSANPYNSANPTGVIFYVHGAGEDQTGLVTETVKFACRDALLDAGYILAGSAAHGAANWGNQPSVDDYNALDLYIRANYNVKSVALWGQSMGGLDTLSAIAQGKFPVSGALLTYPVCNLANLHLLGVYTSAINAAYGITGAGIYTYANQTYGMDPCLKAATAYRDIPMRFYASAGDTVVPKANNTDVLRAIVANSRAESTVVLCTGNHGDASHFQPSDYVAFFARCFRSRLNTITITLKNESNTPMPGLTGVRWIVRNRSVSGLNTPPIAQGVGETTDGSGVMVITFTAALTAGDLVDLELTTSDGTTTQSPAPRGWSGPVAVD